MLVRTCIQAGESKIAKEGCPLTIEEVLDLLRHIGKITDERSEDEFEWSSVEGSIQLLKIFREEDALRMHYSIRTRKGSSDGKSGNVQIDLQFDTSDASLKLFGRALRQELVLLLGSEDSLEGLFAALESKIVTIRESGRAPYERN